MPLLRTCLVRRADRSWRKSTLNSVSGSDAARLALDISLSEMDLPQFVPELSRRVGDNGIWWMKVGQEGWY